MDYQALKAELTSDPLTRGYASMSDEAAAASLNTVNRSVAQGVPVGTLHHELDNMTNGSGVPVWEAIEGRKDAQDAAGVASRAALRLRGARADYPLVNVGSTMFQGQLNQLVFALILTQVQANALTALGQRAVSRAEELGLGSIRPGDVQHARTH